MKHIWMLFLLVSCFKTAEEIERNQMVDQMGVQLEQSAKLVAELTQQVTDLQTRLASTTGQLEEIDHKNQKTTAEQKQTMEQSITQLQEQVKVLSIQASENQKLLTSLQSELDSQKRYSQKVAKTLGKMAKDSRGPTIQEAHKFFEKNKLKEAEEAYLFVLDEGKINAAQTNAVRYNLGLINYWNKKYEDAAAYFSKIYTKWPKSSYAPRSLLYIARSMDKSGKSAEAKAVYEELISKYPDSSQAKTATKEIK